MSSKYNQMNAFRNLINRGSKDIQQQEQINRLQTAFNDLGKKDRASFVEQFYKNCGAKGDYDAYMEQVVSNKVSQEGGTKEGFWTPGQVADHLRISSSDFPTKEAFQASL
eukprot:3156983-Amphidinium_carterae.2